MYPPLNLEIASLQQEQIPQNQIYRQKVRNRRVSLWYLNSNAGIRTKKPERTEEELRKVTEMVKSKNYNHP